MNRSIRLLITGLLGSACLASGARSETLADALALAYQSNPSLLSQRAQLRALDERYVQARRDLRPQLSLDGVFRNTTTLPGDPAAVPFNNRDVTTGTAGVSATQILSTFGKTAAQVSIAEADILAGRELLRQSEQTVLFSVIEAYAAVRRDEQIVLIRTRNVEAFSRQLDSINSRISGGDGTLTDRGQAQAQLASSRAGLAQAQAQLQSSRASYARLVGQNPGTLAPEPNLPGLPATVEAAFEAAEADSPVILQAVMNERAGRAAVQAARAQARPTLSLNGQYAYTGVQYDPLRPGTTAEKVIGLSFSMPLLTGGYNRSIVREAKANEQALYSEIEVARREVLASLSTSWNQALVSQQQFGFGQEAVRAASISTEGSRLEFREGYRSFFEVLNEEQRLLDAQLIVVQATYSRFISQAQVLSGMGRLNAEALLQDVPLYDALANFNHVKTKAFVPTEVPLLGFDRLTAPSDSVMRPSVQPGIANNAVRAVAASEIHDGAMSTSLPVQPAQATLDEVGEIIERAAHK